MTAVAFAHPVDAHGAPDDAVATATYGTSEIWLQRKASDRAQSELVFQESRDVRPHVLDITVPPHDRRIVALGLGLDARGRLVVVMDSKRGLYWTRVAGTPRRHRVSGTTRQDSSPSIFRGQLAYSRSFGAEYSVVRLGSLTGASARTVWTNRSAPQWFPLQTAVGAGSAVAFVTARDGAGNGAYEAQLVRPGNPVKRLRILMLGDTHSGFLAIQGVSSSGRRLTILRQFDGTSATIRFALPTGRRVS